MSVELPNGFGIRSAATVSKAREQKVISAKAIDGKLIHFQFDLIRTGQINTLMGGASELS
jgi:hypothetical protein